MLYLFISCVPFIFLSHSFTQRTLQLCDGVVKLLPIWFRGELSRFLVSWLGKRKPAKTKTTSPRADAGETEAAISLLDLPDLALELVLERLSPAGLRSMAGVCAALRERCRADHLWERHLRRKWGSVVGESARQQWRRESAAGSRSRSRDEREGEGLLESLLRARPFSWIVTPRAEKGSPAGTRSPVDSAMGWFLALESGEFWFPAQVFNRENGHVGFMLSCYDAHLGYDSTTDTFEARYSPHGRRTVEANIEWERLRAPPVDTPPYALHVSDCLQELKPGDHIEIQWRRNKEFPYGWWFGIVGHLETCGGDENHCRCQYDDTIVLEFKQYNPGSRWRRATVNRKNHGEEGNEVDGFYGGIKKLSGQEISRWKRFWPTQVLEQ